MVQQPWRDELSCLSFPESEQPALEIPQPPSPLLPAVADVMAADLDQVSGEHLASPQAYSLFWDSDSLVVGGVVSLGQESEKGREVEGSEPKQLQET